MKPEGLTKGGDVNAIGAASAEALFAQAGLMPESTRPDDNATETALRTDPRLSESQKRALLAVYRSYIGANGDGTADDAADI